VRPLNLATQPFRNETLPALRLAVGGLVLAALTVQHALTIRALLPARTSEAHRRAAELEAEAARLRAEARDQRVTRPEAPVVAQWTLLKELVDKRAFSWTGLFGVLEEVLPAGVRLVSISPRVEKGVVTLEVIAATRSYDAGLDMIRVLEERPEFADVFPLSRGDEEDTRFRYTMRYLPQPPSAGPGPAASPAPGADGEQDEGGEDGATDGQARAAARLEVR
jgi:Tfp pilus assembly protein PilN